MKRWLFFISLVLLAQSAQAQCPGCIIDLPALPADTVYLSDAPDGELGVPYDEDVSFRLPQSTTPVPNVPPGLPIEEITILSIVNLPPGLDWEANQNTFDLPDETDGCVKLCGTPLLSDSFEVEVVVLATVFGISQTSSFSIDLYIAPATSSTVGFSMTNNIGCGSTTVSFTNNLLSGGNPDYSYLWDFGNGNFSNQENPTDQTYNLPGVYEVSYSATIDTADFYLTTVTVTATNCDDILNPPPANKPDLYIRVKDPGGTLIYTSSVQTNADLPAIFGLNLPIGAGNYILEVKDEDLIGEEHCGDVNFSQTTSGVLTDGSLQLTLDLFHPVTVVNSVDTVIVYEAPAEPIVTPADPVICESESVLLSSSYPSGAHQWYLDSLPLQAATEPTLEADAAGIYWVVYTSPDGCTATSEPITLTILSAPPSPEFGNVDNLLAVIDPDGLPVGALLQWSLEGVPVPGATDPSFCLDQEGTFEVTLEVTDPATGCSAQYTATETYDPTVDCTVGVRPSLPLASGRIYPNPFDAQLTIEITALPAGEIALQLFAADGRPLQRSGYDHPGGDFIAELFTGELPAGFYWLELRTADGRATYKLLKP